MEILLQCLFFITINIIVSFEILDYQNSEYGKCFLICIPVIAAYFCRKYVKEFFSFYFLHFLFFVAAILFARSGKEAFFYCIEILFLSVYSSHIKLQTTKMSEERVPLAALAAMIFCYVAGLDTQNQLVIQSGLLLLVFFTIAEIIYNNLDKVNTVFVENRENVNFPAKQLFNVNRSMLIISAVIVFLGMMAFYSGPYGNFFQMIAKFFFWLNGRIGALIFKDSVSVPHEVSTNTETLAMPTQPDTIDPNFVPLPPGSFSQLINTLLGVFAIIVTIVLIIKIIMDVRNSVKKKKYGADLIEFVKPKKKEKDFIKRLEKNSTDEESEIDYNLKLRKLYKKKVKKGIGNEKIPASIFPEDVTRKAITDEKNEAKDITDIYEKARYSNEKINSEEIEKVKNVNITVNKSNK
jgi:hypothetical protein